MIIDDLRKGILTTSALEMQEVASLLAQNLPNRCVLALKGDLGTGKTTFIQGLAKSLNVTDFVTSPTYTIANFYQGDRLLVHVDAYRLDTPHAWEGLMVEDFLVEPFCLAIEWPERLRESFLDSAWQLEFSIQLQGKNSGHLIKLL
jgi:tRNA threonylcarbamoyladenosine biosynthesis protein TsaE